MTIFPYQIEGAKFLAGSRRALLADAPRVGKTAAGIHACDLVGAKSILWVTTGSARWDHAAAWKKFSPGRPVNVVTRGTDTGFLTDGVNIVSRDLMPNLRPHLRLPWDVVVLDESHSYKSRTAKRTQAVYGPKIDLIGGVLERATYTWCLSGTPAPNHYDELWTMLHALAPERILGMKGKPVGYWAFAEKFCILRSNGFGTEIAGSRNADELKRRMKGFVLRRTLEQIAPEVPKLRVDTLRLDTSNAREVERLAKQYPELEQIAKDLSEDKDVKGELQKAGPAMRMLGLLKVEGLAWWIADEVPAKRVVFAWHTDVIQLLKAKLEDRGLKAEILDGSVVGIERQRVVERFRDPEGPDVLIGQIVAAGEAIDLSIADEVIFLESSWVPGHNEQASLRVVNVAKTRPTNARFVVVPNTVDERIQSSVARKVAEISKLY